MKQLILSLIFIFIVGFGFAQKFNGGAMIGIAPSQVAGDKYSGFNKAGPLAGVFVNFQPVKHSSLQMELYYVQKGSRKNANAVEQDYESYLLRLNYVEMPLLYKLHIGWFAIEAGPSIAFLMSGYEERNGEDIKADDFATATFQLNFGVVFTIAQNWKIDIRTNNSLTNLRNQTYTGHVSRFWTHGQFNDVLQITFAYQFFHFGK
ncbi:MAG: PorT family protein [Bacteroidales bacterium]|nr:PorT family protein [Bacteroidales bacterium]